ncbi:MAG: haloacid dehalogenase type II [Acidimicrobiales bacterium]
MTDYGRPPLDDVEALLFDVFGTVVDWRASIISALGAFARLRMVDRDWAAVADDWRACYQPALEEVRSGRRPYVKLDVLHRECLIATLQMHGVKNFTDDDLDWLTNAWHQLRPWPDSVEGLARLGSQATLVSLSNADQEMATNIAEHAGVRWDVVLGAEPAKTYKPRPEVYLTAARTIGLRPGQIMMVAAHNHDLEAAAKLGFRTALVVRPTEHGPGQTTDLEPTGPWDLVCQDLNELAYALEARELGHPTVAPPMLETPGDRVAPEPVETEGSGFEAPRLTRVRLVTLMVVIALASALAFDSGHRQGVGQLGDNSESSVVHSGEAISRQPSLRSTVVRRTSTGSTAAAESDTTTSTVAPYSAASVTALHDDGWSWRITPQWGTGERELRQLFRPGKSVVDSVSGQVRFALRVVQNDGGNTFGVTSPPPGRRSPEVKLRLWAVYESALAYQINEGLYGLRPCRVVPVEEIVFAEQRWLDTWVPEGLACEVDVEGGMEWFGDVTGRDIPEADADALVADLEAKTPMALLVMQWPGGECGFVYRSDGSLPQPTSDCGSVVG